MTYGYSCVPDFDMSRTFINNQIFELNVHVFLTDLHNMY